MADDATGTGTQAGTNGETAQGGAGDISALFGDPPDPAGQGDGTTSADGVVPPSSGDEEYVGKIPKQFYREDGNHDLDGFSKAYRGARASLETANARIKELEAKGAPVDQWDAYAAQMDWDAVKEKAPNAYQGGGPENKAAMSLLHRLHEQNIPLATARTIVSEYYGDLDGMVPEAKDDATLRKEAVAHLGPNGQQMAGEVQSWLESRHATKPFAPAELEILGQMVANGPALSLLWQMSRAGVSSGPPTGNETRSARAADPDAEKKEVRKLLGTLDDAEWSRNKAAILARARAAGLDQGTAWE